jgi:arginine N-succinyltransferase
VFIVRSVNNSDIDSLYELSSLVTFINLPHDREIITALVNSSVRSFNSPDKDKSKNYYLFVLEDLNEKKIVGASLIHAQHGTDDIPHFFFKVSKIEKFSETINTGFIHGTLKLDYEPNGYSEIGGLVIHPNYRGHKEKLGKFLSFVRFLYMSSNPHLFTKEVHSELMPPLDQNGKSPLWEAIGRKFVNMEYFEADKLSRTNKEFILNLFPLELIYESLLPPAARDSIGKVNKDTIPVKNMLEKIGFKYTYEVDPFDGGPHYRATLAQLSIIKNMYQGKVNFESMDNSFEKRVIITIPSKEYAFKAIQTNAKTKNLKKELTIPLELKEKLNDKNINAIII